MVSIIIPVKNLNRYLAENIVQLIKLDYPNFEVLIVIDQLPKVKLRWSKLKFIKSGKIGPARKRDLGAQKSRGKILAFLDDDAYPSHHWLKVAVLNFTHQETTAVGGPGVTPANVAISEKVAGYVNASPVGAGPYGYRFIPGHKRLVDDYPSMNLLVRKTDFVKVGGFDSHYYPGEDTKLCLDLVNLHKKIIYEPKALVYHHRRPILRPFLKQNGNYGLHRGFFAKKLPQTSAKPVYFMPSILLIYLILLPTFFILIKHWWILSLPLITYLFLVIINALWIGLHSRSILVAFLSVPTVVLTHLWYGAKFIQGYIWVKKLTQ